MIENPVGMDAKERDIVRRHCFNSKKDMEKRWKAAQSNPKSKYYQDKEILELLGEKPKEEKPIPKPKKEIKKNA